MYVCIYVYKLSGFEQANKTLENTVCPQILC